MEFLRLDESIGAGGISGFVVYGEIENIGTVFQLDKTDAVIIKLVCDVHCLIHVIHPDAAVFL